MGILILVKLENIRGHEHVNKKQTKTKNKKNSNKTKQTNKNIKRTTVNERTTLAVHANRTSIPN